MFYSVFVLGKKGPLARVWLAAHWDKKITKAQILETNISESVDSILQPRVRLSLRTSSHLLLGIVRIYARKTMYLLQDCQDAAFKIKSAFRSGTVDLPDGKTEAAFSAITLPEVLDFINDFDLITEPQINVDLPHTSTNIKNITLEDVSNIIDDAIIEWEPQTANTVNLKDGSNPLEMFDRDIPDDGFDPSDIFPVSFAVPAPVTGTKGKENDKQSPVHPRNDSRVSFVINNTFDCRPSVQPLAVPPVTSDSPGMDIDEHNIDHSEIPDVRSKECSNELSFEQIFGKTLPHLSVETQMPKPRGRGAAKNKRRGAIIIDDRKTIRLKDMKAQLLDVSDTVCNLDLAPPSKKLMMWKKNGGSEKLFSLPERFMPSSCLLQMFSDNCVTRPLLNHEEESLLTEHFDYQPNQINETHHLSLPVTEIIKVPINEELSPIHDSIDDENYDPNIIPMIPERSQTKQKSPIKRKIKPINDDQIIKRKNKEPKLRDITQSSEEAMRSHSKDFSAPLLDASFPPLDYENDYRPLNSVYPISEDPEEQLEAGETIEQYEERIRNKRTNVLLLYMTNELESKGEVLFSQLVEGNRKKVVGQKFFSLLVLKKHNAIELTQDPNSYSEIIITKGQQYNESVSSF